MVSAWKTDQGNENASSAQTMNSITTGNTLVGPVWCQHGKQIRVMKTLHPHKHERYQNWKTNCWTCMVTEWNTDHGNENASSAQT